METTTQTPSGSAAGDSGSWRFWLPWSIDLIVALVFLGFFFVGLADGSVSSFNIALWMLVLGVVCGVVGGSLALRASAYPKLATALVTALAVPGILVGLFFLVILVVPARWN
jgi:hypothetical protein